MKMASKSKSRMKMKMKTRNRDTGRSELLDQEKGLERKTRRIEFKAEQLFYDYFGNSNSNNIEESRSISSSVMIESRDQDQQVDCHWISQIELEYNGVASL